MMKKEGENYQTLNTSLFIQGIDVITVREANELRDQIARPNGSDAMDNFQRVAT